MKAEDFIYRVATHPKVWPWIAGDADPGDFEIGSGTYLVGDYGYMVFYPWAGDWLDCHIAMLPKSPPAGTFVMGCLDEMERRGAKGFVARIPASSRHVVRLARQCGFKECGRVHGCINGHDLIIMERATCCNS